MKKILICLAVFSVCLAFAPNGHAQKRKPKVVLGKVCGNPNIKCKSGDYIFGKHELPFEVPSRNVVIYESEPFYAIVLKSYKTKDYTNCENAISERDRLEIQDMFPNNKVFALNCLEPGSLYYTNVAVDVNFIAVYAGKTLAEANKFLKTVQSTGKFKGIKVRKMQSGINGT